jgi:UDP-N-acetylmuramoylalanine--D-glutamate ligase
MLMPTSEIELRGEHNVMNVVAACAIAAAAGATPEAMRAGVAGFHGAPHRLEFVRNVNGVDYFNDSIATAPQRAEASLRSFDQPVVLLLGGRDKDLDWTSLAQLAAERARRVVLFGEAADGLQPLFPGAIVTAKFDDAVKQAAQAAQPGDAVLLAPGGTSFDEFKDFEARGERFRQLVNEL